MEYVKPELGLKATDEWRVSFCSRRKKKSKIRGVAIAGRSPGWSRGSEGRGRDRGLRGRSRDPPPGQVVRLCEHRRGSQRLAVQCQVP